MIRHNSSGRSSEEGDRVELKKSSSVSPTHFVSQSSPSTLVFVFSISLSSWHQSFLGSCICRIQQCGIGHLTVLQNMTLVCNKICAMRKVHENNPGSVCHKYINLDKTKFSTEFRLYWARIWNKYFFMMYTFTNCSTRAGSDAKLIYRRV